MEDLLRRAVDTMMTEGAEFCDARYQTLERTDVLVVDGGIRTLSKVRNGGLCLRARLSGAWGYASLLTTEPKSMVEAAIQAVKNAKVGTAKGPMIDLRRPATGSFPARVKVHPSSVPLEDKLALAMEVDKGQQVEARVVNRNTLLGDAVKKVWVENSQGTSVNWEEVRGRLIMQTVVAEGDRREIFYKIIDGTKGFEQFQAVDPQGVGGECASEAIRMLTAKKCPSGYLTCITDPSISGTLAHEVMGHASEADEIVKNRSFLSSVVGKKVASEDITMVDDGTVVGAYGCIPFDDEGTPASHTLIIKDGVYQGYMHSLETAAQMKVPPTGNGRAQDHLRRVFVRMTNTYFEPRDWTLEEMIEEVKHGVIAERTISGMEDPVGGGFEAKALRCFLIENGGITDMLRGATLTGKALEILKTTDAVGKDLRLDGGNCGKGIEDFVPVSSGGSYCRSKMMIGGG